MKGYINIPNTINVKPCMECGARPIIAIAGEDGYVVQCPNNDHYKTPPGIIDIEDWNNHAKIFKQGDYKITLISTVSQ